MSPPLTRHPSPSPSPLNLKDVTLDVGDELCLSTQELKKNMAVGLKKVAQLPSYDDSVSSSQRSDDGGNASTWLQSHEWRDGILVSLTDAEISSRKNRNQPESEAISEVSEAISTTEAMQSELTSERYSHGSPVMSIIESQLQLDAAVNSVLSSSSNDKSSMNEQTLQDLHSILQNTVLCVTELLSPTGVKQKASTTRCHRDGEEMSNAMRLSTQELKIVI